jgi:hypothetical protein
MVLSFQRVSTLKYKGCFKNFDSIVKWLTSFYSKIVHKRRPDEHNTSFSTKKELREIEKNTRNSTNKQRRNISRNREQNNKKEHKHIFCFNFDKI